MTAAMSDLRWAVGSIVGLLLATGALVAFATAGSAAAGDTASITVLVIETQNALGLIKNVQEAAKPGNKNLIRGVGALIGLGAGVALGSVANYVKWRR